MMITNELCGTYEVTTGHRDGRRLPEDSVRDLTAVFTRDTIATFHGDREMYAAKYEVVGSRGPNDETIEVDMVSTIPNAGQEVKGLVRFDAGGGKADLIYALPGKPRPETFETGDGELRFEMKAQAEPAG